MKHYFKRTIRIVIMAGLMALAGCDKDEPSPIKKEELTSGTGKWKLTALTVKALGQTEDAYSELETWEQDDIYFFNVNGTYQIQAGATKFDASDPDIQESGTWEISGKHLIMQSIGEDTETVDILLLNTTTLKCSLKIDFFGVATTTTATYTKQL